MEQLKIKWPRSFKKHLWKKWRRHIYKAKTLKVFPSEAKIKHLKMAQSIALFLGKIDPPEYLKLNPYHDNISKTPQAAIPSGGATHQATTASRTT